MAAHLEEAAVVAAIPAYEDRVHSRLHVVVDAPRAGSPEEGERPVVGVEHHLLRLPRLGAHEQHPAVAETDMGGLHRHRHAVHQHDFVAPVALVRSEEHTSELRSRMRTSYAVCCLKTKNETTRLRAHPTSE